MPTPEEATRGNIWVGSQVPGPLPRRLALSTRCVCVQQKTAQLFLSNQKKVGIQDPTLLSIYKSTSVF